MKKILLIIILIMAIFQMGIFATPWDVSTATYADKYKNVATQDTYPYGLAFSSDGTKMYIVGTSSDTVYQYTLSTTWDISTAEYANKSVYVGDEDTSPYGVTFSSDGDKMYFMGYGSDTVYQYTLSTGWDVSTATYADKSKSVTAQESAPRGVTFSPNGTKMYIVGTSSDTVYQYTLSTAWDVSTATYANKYKSVTAQDTSPYGSAFNTDGTKMYIMGYGSDTVYQYTLSTAWDVSTATYDDKYKSVTAQQPYPRDVAFSPDGMKMYIVGDGSNNVYQYTLPEPPEPEEGNTIIFGMNF